MDYPKYVTEVIEEIISVFKEKRMRDCHWIDLARLKKFNFEKDAPPVYAVTVDRETGKWKKIKITPPFLSTWKVARGFKRRQDLPMKPEA